MVFTLLGNLSHIYSFGEEDLLQLQIQHVCIRLSHMKCLLLDHFRPKPLNFVCFDLSVYDVKWCNMK